MLPVFLLILTTLLAHFFTGDSNAGAHRWVIFAGDVQIVMLFAVLVLGWLMAAIIRACVGSATIAGITAAGMIAPLMLREHTDPNLMVLAVGAGSLMFSHVNDAGVRMFKEYFNLSIKNTLLSWSVMETIVGTAGLLGVLTLEALL